MSIFTVIIIRVGYKNNKWINGKISEILLVFQNYNKRILFKIILIKLPVKISSVSFLKKILKFI